VIPPLAVLLITTGLYWPLLAQSPALSSSAETGLPLIRNYSPREYRAAPDVWAIVQDPRGGMYFGCGNGVLEYDGVSWRLIRMSSGSTVYVLAEGNDGRIYAGGKGDFGFLAPDSSGQLQFVSLLDKVEPPYRKFNEINSIAVMDEGVLFQCFERLFLYTGNTIKVWQPKTSFGYVIQVGNTVYIRQNGLGLMQIIGDSLQFIPGGEILANEVIVSIVPYPQEDSLETGKHRLLIVSFNKGLFLFDHVSLRAVMPEATALLKPLDIYRATVCPTTETLYALASLGNGLSIVNKEGQILKHLNKNDGLISNKVNALYFDRQNALWLATQNGISRVELFSPFSIYDDRLGFPGPVKRIFRYQGALYLLDQAGAVFALIRASQKDQHSLANTAQNRFQRMPNISAKWDLIPFGNSWLAAGHRVILQVRNGKSYRVCEGRLATASTLHRSQVDSNRVYVGDFAGLFSIRRIPDFDGSYKWINEGGIEGVEEEITRIIESGNGDLWLETNGSYPARLKFAQMAAAKTDPPGRRKPVVERYGAWHGLPNSDIYIYPTTSHPVFVTEKGLFRFIEKTGRFVPDSTYGSHFADGSPGVDMLVEDRHGNTWIATSEAYESVLNLARRQPDSSYELVTIPFLRVSVGKISAIYPEDNGITWFGGTERFVRYDSNIQQDLESDFPTLIRRVTVNGDSIIYGGTFPLNLPSKGKFEEIPPGEGAKRAGAAAVLEYSANTLRFEFAAPCYEDESANRFQYFLEGFDREWSDWRYETQKDYTNLPPGSYRFQVRARNIYEQPGSEAVYSFRIMPPWYRTWWAYACYFLLLTGFLSLVRKYELNRIRRKDQQELEHIEYEKLKELDSMKSRFFANISHEFRTPLTLILGPIENMISKMTEPGDRRKLKMMRRHAHHLLQLINQLLDLSKLESGKMHLQATCQDVIPVLRGIISAFQSMAEKKKIDLQFHSEVEKLELYFDQDKYEKIFYNLLSNAVKFTPEGGKVSLTLGIVPPSNFHLAKGEEREVVQITVKDTGIGIPEDKLPHIFDRFYQIESDGTRDFEGTGIGLSLAKELVELHHGAIEVRSQAGWGTEAIVQLPLGRAHLQDEEMVETTAAAPADTAPLMPVESDKVEEAPQGSDMLAEVLEQSEEPEIVLVVEDNVDMRSYTRQYLAQNYQVIEAQNGREGVDKAMETIPDLVISDIMMPVMDGYALCNALKSDEKTCHIPVILLTAKAAQEEKLKGLETGADDYLVKPFEPQELLARTKNLIELRQKLREKFSSSRFPDLTPAVQNKLDQVFLKRVQKIIEENLEDEAFGVEELAQKLRLSRTQLHRKLSALSNRPASLFIRSVRLYHAGKMLEENEFTVNEVAYSVGFSSHAYFSKCFREEFGCTPKEFVQTRRGI
jgi:signal transduction histidine kinase/DNA-binding response OmpR family regulator